jgi:hypothetical protein
MKSFDFMKVIIAGSRTFTDYDRLRSVCDYMLQNQKEIEIVSGTAWGADTLGEKYAQERGYKVTRFPAEWSRFGRSAGYRRNEEMAGYADALIAFWDGQSRGTKHMMDLAVQHGLKVKICRF